MDHGPTTIDPCTTSGAAHLPHFSLQSGSPDDPWGLDAFGTRLSLFTFRVCASTSKGPAAGQLFFVATDQTACCFAPAICDATRCDQPEPPLPLLLSTLVVLLPPKVHQIRPSPLRLPRTEDHRSMFSPTRASYYDSTTHYSRLDDY